MGISFGIMTLTPLADFWADTSVGAPACSFWGRLPYGRRHRFSTFNAETHPEAYGLLPDGDKIPLPGQISAAPAVSKISLRIIFKDSRFWTIAISQSLIVMVIMSVFVHQVAYAVDNEINSIAAASSLAAISVTGFIGQFFFGWLSDRLRDAKYAYFLGISFLLCGMILLNYADNVRSLYLYAVIYGFGYGCIAPILPILIVDRFGRHTLGSIYGLRHFYRFYRLLRPYLGRHNL